MVTRAIALGPAFDNLADDTEETLVGSSFHQDAIVDAYISLKRHRRRRNLPWFIGNHNLPWFIGNQTKLVIPRAGHGPPYQPSPDLMVYPALGTDGRASIAVATFGPPALVIEVVSPSTALANDLNFDAPGGKPHAYAAIGVAEYLTFDLFGDYIPEQIRAWHLGPTGLYIPWEPDSPGRWASALGVTFVPQGRLLRVYDDEGLLVPNYEDLEETIDDLAGTVSEQARQLAERDRRIAEMEEALRRLQGEP